MPNLLERIGGAVSRMMDSGGDPPDVMDPRFWGGFDGSSLSGQNINDVTGLKVAVARACLGRLSGTISTLPMMVFRRTGDDDSDREPATDHPLYKILHRRPNARQSAQEFREELQFHLGWWRNFYCQIVPNPATGDPVGGLEILHPRRLVSIDKTAFGIIYRFRELGSQLVKAYPADEIWHVRRAPLTDDGLMGMPVWQTAKETLAYALAIQQFGALYFKNGGSGGGVIKMPGTFKSPADRDQFIETWRSQGTGLNRHKDRVLSHGAEYQGFTVNNDEAQFNESRRDANSDCCREWAMPPHMVGILDKATFANIEQQSLEYVVHCIAPPVTGWEQGAERDLLVGDKDQNELFIELNVAGLMRGDLMNRLKAFGIGRQWGWLSANDVRRFENMPSLGPKGDKYLQPLNMNPAGAPQADGEADAPGQDDNDPSDNPIDPGNGK